jgi:cyclopropane-fatty-acyl-phospholipid synthase
MSGARVDRLLAHAHVPDVVGALHDRGATVAERIVRGLLDRMARDRLVVEHRIPGRPVRTDRYGPGGELEATVVVTDPRAWSAIVTEGSVGFGRGFVEGWWTTTDPVTVVRVVIRNLGTIDRWQHRWHRGTGWFTDRARAVLPRHTRERNRDDIGAHYDIGNSFFELFLDETMTYSSAVFPHPAASLADGSRFKYDLLLDKLGVTADHHLLEIGTGWGGMAIRAAGERGCRVTTTTISAEQLAEARRRIDAAGLADSVTVLDHDWRDLEGRFDRLVSIEMIEAVDWRDYDDFFATIERCLVPDGLAAIQAICLPDRRWARAKNTVDFIRRFVFPNGYLPSVGAIGRSVERATTMQVLDVEDFTAHYAETLRRWRERFDARVDDVAALGLDDRFQRLWRCYLAYCEGAFRERHVTVVQIVLAGREWRGGITCDRAPAGVRRR